MIKRYEAALEKFIFTGENGDAMVEAFKARWGYLKEIKVPGKLLGMPSL